MKGLVVFSGQTDHPLGWVLKPGFRHVFCAVLNGECWILVDARSGAPDVRFLTTEDFDLAGFYRERGYTVVEVEQGSKSTPWPLAIRNCVGAVKAVLCIRSWAVTPYQLFTHLTRQSCN